MNKRQTGAESEQKAASFLAQQHMRIKERNFRSRQGEIDIIGYHEGYLVFVEVKYRCGTKMGYAAEAVGLQKQRQICKVADFYRMIHHIGTDAPIRYDVVAIQGEEIIWIRNAFNHIYTRG